MASPLDNSTTDNATSAAMPKRPDSIPPRTAMFGDAAAGLEIAVLLLLDVVAVRAPEVGDAFVDELDKLLARRLPTPGLQAHLTAMRDHLAGLLGRGGNNPS